MNAKSVTLEEFLADDYESYEYIKRDLYCLSFIK